MFLFRWCVIWLLNETTPWWILSNYKNIKKCHKQDVAGRCTLLHATKWIFVKMILLTSFRFDNLFRLIVQKNIDCTFHVLISWFWNFEAHWLKFVRCWGRHIFYNYSQNTQIWFVISAKLHFTEHIQHYNSNTYYKLNSTNTESYIFFPKRIITMADENN